MPCTWQGAFGAFLGSSDLASAHQGQREGVRAIASNRNNLICDFV
jgi:hypothetical protein